MTSWTKVMTSQPLFQSTFILRRPEVAIFADIIKFVTMFIKTIFKDSRKVKRIINYAIYICISWCSKICWFLVKECWCQQNSRGVSRDSYIFWIFLRQGITVPSFIIVEYVWQILGRGGLFTPPPHPSSVISPENAHPEEC